MSNTGYTFTIQDAGSSRQAIGDRLTISSDGSARLYLLGKLIGIIKPSHWTRIYVEPNKAEGR